MNIIDSKIKSQVFFSIPGDEYSFSVYCYLYNMFVPQSLELTVVSVYLTSQGAPNIVTSITNLPMKLLLKPCTPIKDADYKVTICTNKPAVSLIDLYPGIILIILDY